MTHLNSISKQNYEQKIKTNEHNMNITQNKALYFIKDCCLGLICILCSRVEDSEPTSYYNQIFSFSILRLHRQRRRQLRAFDFSPSKLVANLQELDFALAFRTIFSPTHTFGGCVRVTFVAKNETKASKIVNWNYFGKYHTSSAKKQ